MSRGPLSIDEFVGLGAPHIWLWIADSDALAGLGIYQHDVLVVNRVGRAEPGRAAIVVIDHEFKLCSILTDAERKRSLVTIDLAGGVQADWCTPDMFAEPPRRNCGKLMETIDLLNQRYGRGAVRVGTVWPGGRAWEIRREMRSPAYTSSWRELPRAS